VKKTGVLYLIISSILLAASLLLIQEPQTAFCEGEECSMTAELTSIYGEGDFALYSVYFIPGGTLKVDLSITYQSGYAAPDRGTIAYLILTTPYDDDPSSELTLVSSGGLIPEETICDDYGFGPRCLVFFPLPDSNDEKIFINPPTSSFVFQMPIQIPKYYAYYNSYVEFYIGLYHHETIGFHGLRYPDFYSNTCEIELVPAASCSGGEYVGGTTPVPEPTEVPYVEESAP